MKEKIRRKNILPLTPAVSISEVADVYTAKGENESES